MVPLLIASAMLVNMSERVRIRPAVLYSFALILSTLGIISQGFVEYPETMVLEIYIVALLVDVMVMRFVFRPAKAEAMRIIWFVSVAIAIVLEGTSAAVTGETVDLILTGTAAIAIFVYSFIKKEKLWFVLAICSLLGIAVYLSITFWGSFAWMIYLLIAGVILIAFAAANEWGKRNANDGKKRRLFEEWKW